MPQGSIDPSADGQAWAQTQAEAFAQWATTHGGGDTGRWDFSADSLDVLSYIIFDRYPTAQAIDDPRNAAFAGPATWYLGEIVRRSDPKKYRWSHRKDGLHEGHYVVERTAKALAWGPTDPHAHLRSVVRHGDPMWLRSHYLDYITPLWTKPWPADIHANETGNWSWDAPTQQWQSQRERWLHSVAGFIGKLAAHLPNTSLDYSTTSLEAVERFVVNHPAAQQSSERSGVAAYLGECLLRCADGGGRWIWDVHPDHLTNGFPIVKRNYSSASPAHLIEYARNLGSGQVFGRIHKAWIADAEDRRAARSSGPGQVREPTPGLDPIETTASSVERWAARRQAQFHEWAACYGPGQEWDHSDGSLDALAQVVLEHCPQGAYLLDAPVEKDFIEGALWYFGETLRRAKPSRWEYSPHTAGRPLTGLEISTNQANDGYPLGVFLVQEANHVVQPTHWRDPPPSQPEWLRKTYRDWVNSSIKKRVEDARKRREQAKRRAGRKGSDEDVLARWLAARADSFAEWTTQFSNGQNWDFSVDSLDALEALILRQAPGPEHLLEDKGNAAFLDGAAWYFGETLRRMNADRASWSYDRGNRPEPYLWTEYPTDVYDKLAEVYIGEPGALRRCYDSLKRG